VKSPLAFSPRALDDVLTAADWYDSQRSGLGDLFLLSVEACLSRIERLPSSFPESVAGVRSALVRRFPYAVLFRIGAERIEVLAVWHDRRDPAGWRDRL
jgi:plasmid stabilization system protein ParE